ncbi:MAG: hypothetical protein NT001_04950, partial [Candidatus Woesearchaeota archaeon]|nr:hypothetical protein [Candidatus Woesearchaeota archaeon]
MKKIFFPSILFMVLLAAGVSAKVDVNYNFYDIHTTYAVNNVDTLVYPCLDAGCNNLMLSRSLPGTGNSGSSSNTIVTYPTNLITKYGYAAFYFEPGYVPEEAKADWSGNGNTRYSIPFNKIFYCKSNITEFDVGADANGDVAINSSIRSAFSRANKIVGYTPPAYIDYYSSLVRTNVTVYNEDNAVVYESARTDNILMDGNVDFNLSFNLASGNYTAVIVTNVTDDQCASSLTRERQVEFEIPEIPTPIEPLNVTLTANLISGSEPLNVSLNCSVQGGESQYNYSFYDNMVLFFNRITDSNSISLTRTFSAGNHTATCFVSDSDGRNDSDSVMITVNATHIPECRDSIDNDGDGLIDYPTDSGCENPGDDNETDMITPPECSDLIDNDGDGFIDYPADPGCVNATDDDEYNNNTINEAPLVTLRFPSDNSSFSIGNLVFIYGVVDDYSPLLSCTFYSNITGTFAPMMSQVTANGGIGFFNT